MKRISTEIWKQFQPFSQNMPGIKKNTTREATISTNHKTGKKKKRSTGEATISMNPLHIRSEEKVKQGKLQLV